MLDRELDSQDSKGPGASDAGDYIEFDGGMLRVSEGTPGGLFKDAGEQQAAVREFVAPLLQKTDRVLWLGSSTGAPTPHATAQSDGPRIE
jgi:hypothetical protein